MIRFHSDLDLLNSGAVIGHSITNADQVQCIHVDGETGDFTSMTAGTVTLTSTMTAPSYLGTHMNLTAHVQAPNVSAL